VAPAFLTAPQWRLTAAALLAFTGAASAQPLPTAQNAPGQGAIGSGPEIRAQLTPHEFTTLSSEIAARIDRITTRLGEHFKKGDVLVEFDCAIPRAQVARADAVEKQGEKTVAINRRLLQLKSVGQLELEVAQAELAKAKADLAVAQATASKCTIAAPFSGVTVEQKAREFQYTAPGQPLLDILNDHNLEVELIAPSRWLSWIRIGGDFKVKIDETEKTYAARVTRIGGRVDPVSQSIKVIGEIAGPAPELIAGMSGQVIMAPPNER
jgi:RND family efflux transporter MFP subunit